MNANAPRRRSLPVAVCVTAVFGLPFVLPVLALDAHEGPPAGRQASDDVPEDPDEVWPTEIRDGQEVEEDEFPEVVALGRFPSSYMCSGVLISPRIVLTAGHCGEKNKPLWVYVGTDTTELPDLPNIATADYRQHGIYQSFSEPVHHKNFSNASVDNRLEYDLMLVVLKEPVQADLPSLQYATADQFDTTLQRVKAVGFGNDEEGDREGRGVKRTGELDVVKGHCDEAAAGEYDCNIGYEFIAGAYDEDTGGKSLCSADSGAPIFIETQEGLFLAGINSRATRKQQTETPGCGAPSNITRIDYFVERWLKPEVKKLVAKYNLDASTISLLQEPDEPSPEVTLSAGSDDDGGGVLDEDAATSTPLPNPP